MRLQFRLISPEIVSRTQLKDVWPVIKATFAEAVKDVQNIRGRECMSVTAKRIGVSEYFIEGFAFPLQLTLLVSNGTKREVPIGSVSARIHSNGCGKALAWVEGEPRNMTLDYRGETGPVVRDLVEDMLTHAFTQAQMAAA